MGSADVAYVLMLSAGVAALIALLRSGLGRSSYGLTALVAVNAACDALILFRPALWTPEFCTAREAAIAILGAVAALELGRGVLRPAAGVWLGVCRRVAVLLVPLALAGVLGLVTLAGTPRVGYRGLLVVHAAVAALLGMVLSAVSLYELPRRPLTTTALRGLLRYFAVQVLYLASWEASVGLAQWLGWASMAVFVWAMLAITRQAMADERRPNVTAARVSA